MKIKPINISKKLEMFNEHWTPKKIGELNDQQVLLAKLKGEFIWHKHENEDELFIVIKGSLKIALREKTLVLNEGEMCIIPKGVEHKPIAEKEVHVLLFEPLAIKHTGNIINNRTVEKFQTI
jgi:mannose-6-phosphate isomerase-like protein (cupin superfamily)